MPPGLGVFLDDNFLIQRIEIALKLRIAAGKKGGFATQSLAKGGIPGKQLKVNWGEPEEGLSSLLMTTTLGGVG